MPVGIINDIRSAISPQSARFVWKITIHVIRTEDHIMAPTIDLTTSENILIINITFSRFGKLTLAKYVHILIFFCSSYAGFLNASSKNQIALISHKNGKKKNPPKETYDVGC